MADTPNVSLKESSVNYATERYQKDPEKGPLIPAYTLSYDRPQNNREISAADHCISNAILLAIMWLATGISVVISMILLYSSRECEEDSYEVSFASIPKVRSVPPRASENNDSCMYIQDNLYFGLPLHPNPCQGLRSSWFNLTAELLCICLYCGAAVKLFTSPKCGDRPKMHATFIGLATFLIGSTILKDMNLALIVVVPTALNIKLQIDMAKSLL